VLKRGVTDMNQRERKIAARIARAVEAARAAEPPPPDRVAKFALQDAACAH
jgi:hypothetical protein